MRKHRALSLTTWSTHSNIIEFKSTPEEVIIEPVKLKIKGVWTARVISKIFNSNKWREVVIRMVNLSRGTGYTTE